LAYAQQVYNNSSPYHKVFQSSQEQIHQSEIYIPATDYPSPRVDSYDSANLNNNGIMTENSTTSPPSFSSDLHDTKPVAISGGHGSHEAYPSTPTTYASASYPATTAPTSTAYLTPGNETTTAPVGYDRNGMQHHGTGFPPGMPPTPQDYPITMGRFSNGGLSSSSNGNGAPKSPGQQRPSSVPTPQAMMTTFSSKTVSSTPKRYKCNICQKRFTRPSSLQTHMYSHTGEKPFKCPIEGCGRHFSVVSNLRRHQKIHSSNR